MSLILSFFSNRRNDTPAKPGNLERFGYGSGNFALSIYFQMFAIYLMYFYTDVFVIPAATVSILFLVTRLWDAINDPLMGHFADHHLLKWGKFRPYLFYGAIPVALMGGICFTTPEFDTFGKTIYAYITYILLGMAITVVSIPYSSLTSVMTQDANERSVIASWGMTFMGIAALLVAIAVKPLVGLFPDEQTGYKYVMYIFGAMSVLTLWICFGTVTERVKVKIESYKIKNVLKYIVKNEPLMIALTVVLLNVILTTIRQASTIYYFKYNLNSENLIPIYFAITAPPGFLGVLISPFLAKRIGKKNTMIIGYLLIITGSMGLVFTNDINLIYFYSAIVTIGIMMTSVIKWAIIPDTVEYGQWKTGKRTDGLIFSIFSFIYKGGMALGGAFAGMVLAYTGYKPNTVLDEPVLDGIHFLFTIIPVIISVTCIIVISFYRLDEKLFNKIVSELKDKERAEELK